MFYFVSVVLLKIELLRREDWDSINGLSSHICVPVSSQDLYFHRRMPWCIIFNDLSE